MRQSRRRAWHLSRPFATILVAAPGPLALLVPVTVADDGIATAVSAVGATSQQVEFFVEGSASAVYERTLTTGFTSLGGAITGGAAATALS